MGRRGLKSSHRNVYTRHSLLPCGKKYSGKKETVMKLIAMHRKVCAQCDECEFSVPQAFRTRIGDRSRDQTQADVAAICGWD